MRHKSFISIPLCLALELWYWSCRGASNGSAAFASSLTLHHVLIYHCLCHDSGEETMFCVYGVPPLKLHPFLSPGVSQRRLRDADAPDGVLSLLQDQAGRDLLAILGRHRRAVRVRLATASSCRRSSFTTREPIHSGIGHGE